MRCPIFGFDFMAGEEAFLNTETKELEAANGFDNTQPFDLAYPAYVIEKTLKKEEEQAEAELLVAQGKVSDLQEQLKDIAALFANFKPGTASREEIEHLLNVNVQLNALKDEIVNTKAAESKAQLKLLRLKTQQNLMEVKTAVKMKDIQCVLETVAKAEHVDLAFIIDATGSMWSHIRAVKTNITNIVQQIVKTNGNLNLRLAMVAYRDIGWLVKRFETLDFVDSVAAFESFVGRLYAIGGADGPEDMAGAIQKANALHWTQPTRVVFIIADAPCHGTEFHPFHDSYPGGTPGIDIKAELRNLLQNHSADGTMTVNFGRITEHTDSMIRRFDELDLHLDVVDTADASKMIASVTKGVRDSISRTVTAPSSTSRTISTDSKTLKMDDSVSVKSYKISETLLSEADWEKQIVVTVQVFQHQPIKSISECQEPLKYGMVEYASASTDKTRESTMFMRCAAEPFAEGASRIAFHARLGARPADLKNPKCVMVLKTFKKSGKHANHAMQYLQQMEVSSVASFLAEEYNKSSHRPKHCPLVRILQVLVVQEEDKGKEEDGNRRFCAEAPLPTTGSAYTKYSSNTGYWDQDILNETLLRFSDFTYKISSGYLLVTDLQGVQVGNEFILTDPAILCKDVLRFGRNNLGPDFMERCITSTRALMAEKGWNGME